MNYEDNHKYEYAICYSLKMIPNKHRYLDHQVLYQTGTFLFQDFIMIRMMSLLMMRLRMRVILSQMTKRPGRVRNWWTEPKHCNSPTHAQCTSIPSLCNLLQIALFSSACTIRDIHKKLLKTQSTELWVYSDQETELWLS